MSVVTTPGQWSAARPILVAVWEMYEEGIGGPTSSVLVDPGMIVRHLNDGTDVAQAVHALHYLETAGYLDLSAAMGNSLAVERINEPTLQELGGWPTGSGDAVMQALVAALDHRIADAPDKDERTKLVRLRDAVVGIGRDVLVQVLSEASSGRLPH